MSEVISLRERVAQAELDLGFVGWRRVNLFQRMAVDESRIRTLHGKMPASVPLSRDRAEVNSPLHYGPGSRALTDIQFNGLNYKIPNLCFGVSGAAMHGFNEYFDPKGWNAVCK